MFCVNVLQIYMNISLKPFLTSNILIMYLFSVFIFLFPSSFIKQFIYIKAKFSQQICLVFIFLGNHTTSLVVPINLQNNGYPLGLND